jgi:Fe-S-cluster-containing dehydrogenase component
MRRKSKPFHLALENEYRKKGLIALLKSTAIFSNVSEIALYQYANEIELLSFESDEEIAHEGESANDLYIVRAGFVKLSRRMGDTEVILNYLSRGAVFGEMEFLKRPSSRFYATVSAVEYVDIIKIPYAIIEKLIPYDFTMVNKINESARQTSRQYKDHEKDLKRSALLQMGMETGIIEGTSILIIDLDRCTRCDDCVRGCADTHGGLPRFVREGSRYENMLITRACYQCKDPMCLIGCPTGAIRRAGIGEIVEIKDDLCIGCKICAVNCPYDAIVMHETGETWGYDALPKNLRGNERLLASKCDLCAGLNHGPACVESCPIGCAMRIESIDELV